MTTGKVALVLGATGGIGGEVAAALSRNGWEVRALHRHVAAAQQRRGGKSLGISWIQGDALRQADVVDAARGVSVIVHAVNPPGYRNWAGLVLPMLSSTIAAARAAGARVLLPGTVYNYGPDSFPVLREDSPQNPQTRKGAIRAEMERRLREASGSGVRSLIVRAGDFFGPAAGNNWFSEGLVKAGRPVRAITSPARRPRLGHSWAYLPDLADTMVRLLERESALGTFETFHFGGHWDADGSQMVEAIRRVVGNPRLPVRRFPWAAVAVTSPFVTLFREMMEMRYLWEQPLRLSNDRLVRLLGAEPHTPLDAAVGNTLRGLGCL
jgi:nucleoside-diphosphate-sugar epimerase